MMYLFYFEFKADELSISCQALLDSCTNCLSPTERQCLKQYKNNKLAIQQTFSYGLRRLALAVLLRNVRNDVKPSISNADNQVIKNGVSWPDGAVDQCERITFKSLSKERINADIIELAKSLRFIQGDYGKPYMNLVQEACLTPVPFAFSLSHCDGFICILVSQSQRMIGVDVEPVKKFDYLPMLHFMHSCEQQKIHCARDFLFFWTRKEAYLKSLGTGLVDEIAQINTAESRIKDERPLRKYCQVAQHVNVVINKKDSQLGGELRKMIEEKHFYCHYVNLNPKRLIHVCNSNSLLELQLVNLRQLF
ncbi:4'-phosphopantetheinyl transferase family protein [Oligella ureolytica]|uniref:4'-phosphopantetheinyl transferase superfamily protein n=2 Tax=Oligella ureolytica TaxID=90244 RepID=A0A7T3BQ36_9BURK|nr:4'-phosphopantetheinyl transferase superfamily protein [Oligella ureolytica]QPT39825.1 4'-phosphopantetheinyl transferase superfamily protein [Oligella ureolytica]